MTPSLPPGCAASPKVRSRNDASSSCRHEHPRGPRMSDVSRETSAPDPGQTRDAPALRGVASDHGDLPEAPPAAAAVFGSRLDAATRYARMLAGDGLTRGLLGP